MGWGGRARGGHRRRQCPGKRWNEIAARAATVALPPAATGRLLSVVDAWRDRKGGGRARRGEQAGVLKDKCTPQRGDEGTGSSLSGRRAAADGLLAPCARRPPLAAGMADVIFLSPLSTLIWPSASTAATEGGGQAGGRWRAAFPSFPLLFERVQIQELRAGLAAGAAVPAPSVRSSSRPGPTCMPSRRPSGKQAGLAGSGRRPLPHHPQPHRQ